MLRFLYVVLFEQSFDSSMDWGERASLERPFAAGHLQNAVSHGDERRKGKYQTLGLVYFIQFLVNCDYNPMSARVRPLLRETHTQIFSNTIGRRLPI
jgi:hypothetical protein